MSNTVAHRRSTLAKRHFAPWVLGSDGVWFLPPGVQDPNAGGTNEGGTGAGTNGGANGTGTGSGGTNTGGTTGPGTGINTVPTNPQVSGLPGTQPTNPQVSGSPGTQPTSSVGPLTPNSSTGSDGLSSAALYV